MFGTSSRFEKSLNGVKTLTDGIITIKNGDIINANNITGDNINTTNINGLNVEELNNEVSTNTTNIQLLQASVTNVINDVTALTGDLDDNYYTKTETDVRYASGMAFEDLQAEVANIVNDVDTNYNNILTNTESINLINDVTIPGLQNQITTNTNNINTINTSSIPNLQSQITSNTNHINNLNIVTDNIDELVLGSYNNILTTTFTTNVSTSNNTLSAVFLSFSMNRNNNREFGVSFPVSMRALIVSGLGATTDGWTITGMTVRINRNGSLYQTLNANPENQPFGKIQDQLKNMTPTTAQGNQYYGNFYFLFTPALINDNSTDTYTIQATPTWTASIMPAQITPSIMINTTISGTVTEIGTITFSNTHSIGYRSGQIFNQRPLFKPNSYLGVSMMNFKPLFELIFPVGYIWINKTNTNNPFTIIGFGVWVQITGRFLRAHNEGGTTGGTADHQHRWYRYIDESGGHTIDTTNTSQRAWSWNSTGGLQLITSGELTQSCYTEAIDHLPPYLNVIMWERTA